MKANQERFLIATVREKRFAFPLKDIAEVMETFLAYPFPKAPREFVGIMNFHGAPVPVLDFDSFLNDCPVQGTGVVLVLDARICSLALRIDGIERIASGKIIEGGNESDWLAGTTVAIGQESIPSPSLERLVKLLENAIQGSGRKPRMP